MKYNTVFMYVLVADIEMSFNTSTIYNKKSLKNI